MKVLIIEYITDQNHIMSKLIEMSGYLILYDKIL